uniref:Putative O-succinylbenzoate synthase n=1 Tax=Paulinella chromatophora TaxID=39717 RepID=B1X4A8_PAUCH|nr:putative O-succinylbenzoate synthase [Paulinella chromatophora]ACB42777.1 putative O-succinylbenzoate synthase [Paulinella chromatophora]
MPIRNDQLFLQWRRFSFELPCSIVTARGALNKRYGYLIRLENHKGQIGWGEVVSTEETSLENKSIAIALEKLSRLINSKYLFSILKIVPPVLRFGIGSALGELEGRVIKLSEGSIYALPSAYLLPAGSSAPKILAQLLSETHRERALTIKWKVGVLNDISERHILEELLNILPDSTCIRLDANGGWDRVTASAWADRLINDPRLQWFEQPLNSNDQLGLDNLARHVPVALDESLFVYPNLRSTWNGWQVRRPALEGDPRCLLAALETTPRLMISTCLETGIGRRWINHLAACQMQGPTPVVPGLAPSWCPEGNLFSFDPQKVWEAAK